MRTSRHRGPCGGSAATAAFVHEDVAQGDSVVEFSLLLEAVLVLTGRYSRARAELTRVVVPSNR